MGLLASTGALGQDATTPPESAVDAPEVGTSLEAVRARITELESVADESQNTALLEVLRPLAALLESAAKDASQSELYRQALENDPRESARVRQEIAAAAATEAPPAITASTTTDLQQLIKQVQGELTTVLRPRLVELEKRIGAEHDRPDAARKQLADAKEKLAEFESQLLVPEPSSEAPEIELAQRRLLEAQRLARWAEIRMLENSLLSAPGRIELLEANRDKTAQEISRAEARLARLETRESELRKAEDEAARREADRLRREAVGKHPLVESAADDTAKITREAEAVGPRIDQARLERTEREETLAQTQASLEETKRSVALGISESLGAVLLEQRRNLPELRDYRKSAADRARQIAEVRLRLFQIDRELRPLRDVPRHVDQILDDEVLAPLDEREAQELRTELERVLVVKFENLKRLRNRLRDDYLPELGRLETSERALLSAAQEQALILDERLLWIRNAVPISTETFRGLTTDVSWFISPSNWAGVGDTVRSDLRAAPALYGFATLLLILHMVSHRKLRARAEKIAQRVGRVRQDGILLTVEAILIDAVRCVLLPAVVAFLGWRLIQANGASDFSKAIGCGLLVASATGFLIGWLRATARAGGLAETHFKWSARSGRVVRKHLLWFGGVALAGTFVIAATQWQLDPLYRHSLGRLSFVTLMLASSAVAFVVLHPRRGLSLSGTFGGPSSWVTRSQPVWRVAVSLVPLSLAAFAVAGYYYAALELEYRLNQTVLLILAAVFAYAFFHRWLLISQRRLALKVATEKREKLREQAVEADGGDSLPPIETEDIDVAEMKEQTQDLLQMAVGMLLLVGLWFVWVGVLPALKVLDSVELGHYTAVVDGKETASPVTLSNVGLGLLVVLVTVTAARNLPGFLEIALLQRLPIDAGARYATRTLVMYAIVSAGIVLAFNAVGIGWSSVQWLVAALTVGLGFGLQEIFANFVSGLIILLERPVRVGDTVTVGSVSGVVTRIRMRATSITDWNRKELVVPNKSFITDALVNWSLSDPILRMDFSVGIAYGSDTTLAHKVMLETCRQHPLVLEQPESNVFFLGFGDNSLDFEVRVFVSETTNAGRTRIVHELHMAIDQACRKNDITIAFPQRDLHLKSAEATIRIERIDTRSGRQVNADLEA